MNYSLDALWWELQTDAVRDLASLLTAPSLWQTDCELSRRELLGDTGFANYWPWMTSPMCCISIYRPLLGNRTVWGFMPSICWRFGLHMRHIANC